MTPANPGPTIIPRLAFAFFCSGFAALMCQIVWQRMLGIFAGSDTVSAALVVGAFLAGLGLGSIIGAKAADRLSPVGALMGFAAAETGVALFAILSKAFLYDFIATDLAGAVDAPLAIFALCFAGLVLPTTLMGASLPLLARAVATSIETVAENVSRLYSLNTLGAGLGALLGGWLLVGNLGFVGALALAAGLDLAAAVLALTLLPSLRGMPAPVDRVEESVGDEPFGGLPLWCLLVFLSGYVIVALEIVWVRLIGQVGQYHAYLFPTVLGVFLLADGAGMAIAARLVRRIQDPRPAFFLTQAGGFALAAALILALWWATPFWPLADLMAVDESRLRGGPLVAMVVLTVAVVGPPSLLIGMTFAFVQRAVQRDLASVGARVGWVQLANIAGNAAGSVGTGLISLHFIGTAGTLMMLAALSVLLLVGWLWRSGWRRLPEIALTAACALAFLVLPGNGPLWDRLHGRASTDQVARAEDRSGVVFFRSRGDGAGQGPEGPFYIQGFSQGRIPFLPIHQLLGSIGPLVHPDPRRVLVIGIGSGGTPWAAGVLPQSRVRAVELINPVLTALEQLAGAYPDGPIGRMFRDQRWQLEYADGRRTLVREEARYDIIEADAILPEGSHSGLLYSEEFLSQVRRRLAPGGLYVQWAPTRRTVETFAAVFPHAVLVQPARILLGSDQAIPFDPQALARRFADPAVVAHLRIGNREQADYGAMVAGPNLVWHPDTPRDGASLSDSFPRDEFYLNNPIAPTGTVRAPTTGG